MKPVEKKVYTGLTDSKARRRVNVSEKVANITAEEIEAGISIEKLESINVPVFSYGTQITIHGKLPSLANTNVCGYRSIFRNGNGTIGVRYIAIDGAKKQKILIAQELAKSKLYASTDSTGLFMQKRIATNCKPESMEAGRKFLASVPDLFIGSKQLVCDAFGCLYISISINAIYQKNLWAFISWFTNGAIATETDYQKKKEERKAKRQAEKEARSVQAEKERKERDLRKARLIEEWEKEGFKHYSGLKKEGLYIIRPSAYPSDGAFTHSLFKKWGKGFKKSVIKTDSKEKQPLEAFNKWKNPSSYYSETVEGFTFN